MPGWSVLDLIDSSEVVTIRKNVVWVGDRRGPAVNDLSGVIAGPKVMISAGALAMLGNAGVPVSFAAFPGRLPSAMVGLSSHDRVASRHRAQSELKLPMRKQLWASIVKAKISGQAAVANGEAGEALSSLVRKVRSGDASNHEGHAARIYWAAISPYKGWKRSSQFGDELNSCLNYGYGVMRNHLLAAIFAAGLWPSLGIHHRHRANAGCLADDLIEPYRPLVDRQVLKCEDWREVALDRGMKTQLAGILEHECPGGEQVRASMNAWTQQIGAFMEDPRRGYPTPPTVMSSEREEDGEPPNVGDGVL